MHWELNYGVWTKQTLCINIKSAAQKQLCRPKFIVDLDRVNQEIYRSIHVLSFSHLFVRMYSLYSSCFLEWTSIWFTYSKNAILVEHVLIMLEKIWYIYMYLMIWHVISCGRRFLFSFDYCFVVYYIVLFASAVSMWLLSCHSCRPLLLRCQSYFPLLPRQCHMIIMLTM